MADHDAIRIGMDSPANPKVRELASSLDHLVGAQQERLWDFEAEGFCSGQIDDEIEFGRLLDWDVARLRPAQNLVSNVAGAAE